LSDEWLITPEFHRFRGSLESSVTLFYCHHPRTDLAGRGKMLLIEKFNWNSISPLEAKIAGVTAHDCGGMCHKMRVLSRF